MLMMMMGVATWMLRRAARDETRHRPELTETVYWVMAMSTAPRAAAEISVAAAGALGLRWTHRAGGARPARRNRSLRAEHVVARAYASGGRAARPLRGKSGTSMGDGPLRHFATV
jgi:hypothetical protein